MSRGISSSVAALLSVCVVGFFAGTRAEWPQEAGYQPPVREQGRGVPAKRYSELRVPGLGPNQEIYQKSRDELATMLPGLMDPVPVRSPEARAAALRRRGERRAFDGAPPTVPHRVDTRALPNCLVCHERGAQIGELVAPAMSHRPFSNCLQCHAEALAPAPALALGDAASSSNAFEPEPFGGLGSRATEGAPPVVPHAEFMRERCNSCHGVSGMVGLRTPHPDRQNCQQCHVMEAGRPPGPPNLSVSLFP